MGGHAAVRGSLLEDVELARAAKRAGKLRFRYAPEAVSARMYRTAGDLVEGWSKNLAALFPNALAFSLWRAVESVVLLAGPVAALLTRSAVLAAIVLAAY